MEKCRLGKQEVFLPDIFLEKSAIFRGIITLETWENVLTTVERQHLMSLLPTFPVNDTEEKLRTLEMLFHGDNFKFGNPFRYVQSRLRNGYFSPEIFKYCKLCRRAKHRAYKIHQQRHIIETLKKIVVLRQRMLAEVRYLAPDQLPSYIYHDVTDNTQHLIMEYRSLSSFCQEMKSLRAEFGIEDTSSDEEKVNHRATPIAAMQCKMTGSRDISDRELVNMLRHHIKCTQSDPMAPYLNTEDIVLDDIISQYQIQPIKKSAVVNPLPSMLARRRVRPNEQAIDRHVKKVKTDIKEQAIKVEQDKAEELSDDVDVNAGVEDMESDEFSDITSLMSILPPPLYIPAPASHFFALLRDILCNFPEQRAGTAKIEEKVQEWKESPHSRTCEWYCGQSWIENVVSALKFLSGDALGIDIEGFIPLVDYTERAQQWKWIGGGRDSDDTLEPLFCSWLQSRHDHTLDVIDGTPRSPAPTVMRTDYIVRPTSENEKEVFRDQEHRRFANPQHGFTYELHGYRSVVGPVKGVYNKDGITNKAREHALLISERPPYITILTLVRDAAARLPNGEGTRGDICELLKDSSFLAPCITDTQLNTVVSGALDRLHYEKDPCVKYDVNRKLWIYLHRNRTEDEFERLHHAQGAAVKAKKSLQKPKPVKRSKDTPVCTTGLILTSPIKFDSGTNVTQLISQKSDLITSAEVKHGTTVRQALNLLHKARSTSTSAATFNTSLQSTIVSTVSLVSTTMPETRSGASLPMTLAFLPTSKSIVPTFTNVPILQSTKHASRALQVDNFPSTTILVSSDYTICANTPTLTHSTIPMSMNPGLAIPRTNQMKPAVLTTNRCTISGFTNGTATPTYTQSSVIGHLIEGPHASRIISMDYLVSGTKMTSSASPSSIALQVSTTPSLTDKVASSIAVMSTVCKSTTTSQPMLVMTQLPQGGIALRPSVQHPSSGRKPDPSMLATQFIVQAPNTAPLAKNSILAGSCSRQNNSVLAGNCSRLQSVQLLKKVVSQAGSLKPGQTTFLIPHATVPQPSPNIVGVGLHAAHRGITMTTAHPPAGGQAMFARILMPPSSMRLTNAQSSPGQGISLAVSAVPMSTEVSTTTTLAAATPTGTKHSSAL